MGNCCLEFYGVLIQSEYEVIEDDNDDRCRAYSSVTNSTYHSEVFPPEYNVPDNSIFPTQFSKFYQIGALVGVGTTSKVYKVHSKFGKRTEGWEEEALVCKIVDKQKLTFDVEDQDVETLLDQLSKEVEILKRIKHQNIVQFYDYMESKDRLFIITERLDGGELFDYILDNGPLSEGFARQILFGVFSAVAYLHERGVVHRDIKAENLIFCKDVNGDIALKLIDFGFSTVLRHAMTGSFMGTGGYIAPEIRQNKIYSTSVDSWSLGVLLYCTLAARLPFGISLDQLPSSLKDCRGAFELVFPTKTWAKVSDPCKDLISKLLEIDPNRRYTVKQALAHPWVSLSLFLSFPFNS
jgi:serine/threonine protein kinase